ncbi:UNVERIFIED_CONTAM: hypothetical protein Slati_4260400 [Sesamum latifolium]|uniref:Reverse transcriptase domain-containing protein n=1 Tax=Sesamum latifolium TaxID=2727402 RepID=A0AAW2TC29_9LAMI
MIQHDETNSALRGVAVSRNGPRVSHLLFADDTLLFVQDTKEALLCVKNVLQLFEVAFGLAVNWHKSTAVFSKNVDKAAGEELGRILGVMVVD